MSSELIGALIALGLGFWAYTDAKALERRGIRVGSFSPLFWGVSVALIAVLFGVLYLRQRSRAIRADASAGGIGPPPSPPSPPGPPVPPTAAAPAAPAPHGERDRFCRSCGHELPAYTSSFCPKCGRAL